MKWIIYLGLAYWIFGDSEIVVNTTAKVQTAIEESTVVHEGKEAFKDKLKAALEGAVAEAKEAKEEASMEKLAKRANEIAGDIKAGKYLEGLAKRLKPKEEEIVYKSDYKDEY